MFGSAAQSLQQWGLNLAHWSASGIEHSSFPELAAVATAQANQQHRKIPRRVNAATAMFTVLMAVVIILVGVVVLGHIDLDVIHGVLAHVCHVVLQTQGTTSTLAVHRHLVGLV